MLPVTAVVGLIIDAGVASLGHRKHLLGVDDLHGRFQEAGAGFGSDPTSACQNYWAFHTGVTDPPQTLHASSTPAERRADRRGS